MTACLHVLACTGAAGVVTGTGKGVSGLVWHPIKGLYHSGQAIGNDTARGVTHVHEHYIIRSSSLDDKDKQKLRKKKSSKTDDSKADDSTASGGSPRASLYVCFSMLSSMQHRQPCSCPAFSKAGMMSSI